MGMDPARVPVRKSHRATIAGVAVAAVVVALVVSWWTARPKSAALEGATAREAVIATGGTVVLPETPTPPTQTRQETEASAPAAAVPNSKRRAPPRFVRSSPSPSSPPARTGQELAKDNPQVLAAISGAAHGEHVTDAEYKAGGQCVRDFAKRIPEIVDSADTARGSLTITVSTKAEEGRVVDIEGGGKEDPELFDCLRKARPWLSGRTFSAPGAPDGITKIEWPYRTRVGPARKVPASTN
jgi:type IV secretory pathway VirB10-like protein